MFSSQRQQNTLDALETSLNSIFLQIGATFSKPTNFEPAHLLRTKAQLQQTLPRAKHAFDDALDQLKYELNHAKSVLLRDMNAIQAQRMQQKSAESKAAMTNGVTMKAQESTSPEATKDDIAKDASSVDVIMQDAMPDGIATKNGSSQSSDVHTSTALPNGISTTSHNLIGNPNTSETQSAMSSNPAQGITTQTEATLTAGTDNAVASEDNDDLDSLFRQDDSKSTNGVNIDMTADQQDTDVNSLLPGLEFYANENNATPGAFDGLGDMGGSAFTNAEAALEISNDGDPSAFMNGIDAQDSMFGSGFDLENWLENTGGQPVSGQENAGQTQFDENFFSLD